MPFLARRPNRLCVNCQEMHTNLQQQTHLTSLEWLGCVVMCECKP